MYIENTLVPYSYPQVCKIWCPWVGDVKEDSQWIERPFPSVVKHNSTCPGMLITKLSLRQTVNRSCGVPSGENIGTDILSTETPSHRANDTPSLLQLLEERIPLMQSVVTCVRFSKSFFELIQSKMPMFGSISGGKSSASGTSDQTGKSASKGARSKEGADQGAMALIPIIAMLHQGRCPPIKAHRVHRIPEIVLPYFLEYK